MQTSYMAGPPGRLWRSPGSGGGWALRSVGSHIMGSEPVLLEPPEARRRLRHGLRRQGVDRGGLGRVMSQGVRIE